MADKILKQVGLIPETDETGQPPAATPALFNGPFGVTQENFDALEPIVQDVLAAKGDSRSLAEKLAGVDTAIGNLETSDAVAVSSAVRLAWSRSDEGYAVEQFSPNMTLITFEPINVTRTVAGDDSVDVESTESLNVGNTYVISGNGGQESVTVAEILNGTRFKATTNLERTLDDGKLGQTDWQIYAGYAIAPKGGTYYSSAMSVLRYYGDGRLDIRRDSGEGKLAVKVRTKGGGWQEAVLEEVLEEKSGTRNEFYKLPVGGIVELQLVADKEIKVDYFMVYTSPEAGRAYPVAQPANLTPTQGAVSVVDPVTFTGTAPRSLYGIAIASATVRIATDSNMQNIIHTGTVNSPSGELSYTAPGGTVEVDKNYWWDYYYTDEDGNTSPISKATGFSTASVFEYTVPPMIISPANNSADVMAPLNVQLSDFAAFGAVDTHSGSRVEASYFPDFSVVFYDSGKVAPGSDIEITENDGLVVGKDLYLRPYHEGTTLGWSAAGPVCHARLADAFHINYWGDGSDGDVVIAADTNIAATLNGDMVVKNYKSLTINEGATLTVDNPCRGLLVYVDGDCEINGKLSFDNMGLCAFDPTGTVSSDGSAMPTSGLVIAKHMEGGTDSGSSNLYGCGVAAVNAESQQAAITNGYKLVLLPTCCGHGGNGGNGHNFSWSGQAYVGGTGGSGVPGNYAGGSGGGGGGSGISYGGGAGGAGGAKTAGNGTAGNHGSAGGKGGHNGIGGTHGESSNSGSSRSAGLLLLMVRGNLTGNGTVSSSTTVLGVAGTGGGGGAGGAGGGAVAALHGGNLDSNLSFVAEGSLGTAGGGAEGGSGLPGTNGGTGTIVTQSIDV